MEGIQFDTPAYTVTPRKTQPSYLVRLCMRTGLVNDTQGAYRLLMIVGVTALIIMLLVPLFSGAPKLPDDGKGYQLATPTL